MFWGSFTKRETEENLLNNRELIDMYVQGKIKPHVSKQYPLAEAGKAITELAERRAMGKVVVTVD